MKAVLLVVVAALFVGTAMAKNEWKSYCTGTLDVKDIHADTPVKGKEFHFEFSGQLSKDITAGNIVYSTYYNNLKLGTETHSFAETGQQFNPPGPLPWKAGEWRMRAGMTVPSNSPSGTYKEELVATDNGGAVMFCIRGEFSL